MYVHKNFLLIIIIIRQWTHTEHIHTHTAKKGKAGKAHYYKETNYSMVNKLPNIYAYTDDNWLAT